MRIEPAIAAIALLATACGQSGRGFYPAPSDEDGSSADIAGTTQDMLRVATDFAVTGPQPDLAAQAGDRDLALPQAPDLALPLPATVTIDLVGATVAPFKADRTKWDGLGSVGQQLVNDLLAALAALVPYGQVIKFLGGAAVAAAVNGYDKPDPFGWAEILVGGVWQAKTDLSTKQNKVEDTFTPTWQGPPNPPGWDKVPFKQGLRVRFHVWDADLANDDVIGTAEISYNDILDALNSQKVWQVDVSGQTQNQLLFVAISVNGQ